MNRSTISAGGLSSAVHEDVPRAMAGKPVLTRPLIAANWKMNGLKASLDTARVIAGESRDAQARVAIFPPFTLLGMMHEALKDSHVILGGQDCHTEDCGAYTGDVSATMLTDMGASMVILGHSERRTGHNEASTSVARKVSAALRAGLEPIICIGETFSQREQGLTEAVLLGQLQESLPDELAHSVFHLAYEPVWAIGTGHMAFDDQIIAAVKLIRGFLEARFKLGYVPNILYGGSVNPDNASHLLALDGVGGALVGGASLKASTFLKIIEAAG